MLATGRAEKADCQTGEREWATEDKTRWNTYQVDPEAAQDGLAQGQDHERGPGELPDKGPGAGKSDQVGKRQHVNQHNYTQLNGLDTKCWILSCWVSHFDCYSEYPVIIWSKHPLISSGNLAKVLEQSHVTPF